MPYMANLNWCNNKQSHYSFLEIFTLLLHWRKTHQNFRLRLKHHLTFGIAQKVTKTLGQGFATMVDTVKYTIVCGTPHF